MKPVIGSIHWPSGIDEQLFLNEIWQKKPLLIRQAFPDFATPLPADELAGLSLEPDTTGRIITQDDNGAFSLEHGPFEEDRFTTLIGNQWSLLVTDVEKHIPEFIAYLQPFRFIPDWRIDDLMISYAPDGGSVGAHVDEYDVFLLQASGVRTWRIDARSDIAHQMRSDGDLKTLANFEPTDEWDLAAGDMLYLPPGMAHHGIAKGDDCTTWSIGFRAPRLPDFVARVSELLSEQMAQQHRYTDGSMEPACPGEISRQSIQRFKTVWESATQLNDADFSRLLGTWLTESTSLAPASAMPEGAITTDLLDSNEKIILQKAPFCRFAWIAQPSHAATLFADGTALPCSLDFATSLCASEQWFEVVPARLNDTDLDVVNTLIDTACLLPDSA
ncbi:AraC family ligand binding domain-containing protein [Granulosicoccus sp.]|nr:AraC family ligand binding domain-containing protein [Granulosicoccus sp.]